MLPFNLNLRSTWLTKKTNRSSKQYVRLSICYVHQPRQDYFWRLKKRINEILVWIDFTDFHTQCARAE